MKWISEILQPEALDEHAPEAVTKAMDEIAEIKQFANDMAVISSHGRRVGGTGDAKIIGYLPLELGPILWAYEPEIFLSKKNMHKFLDANPHFKLKD
jgi:hypothetical protein